MAIKFESLRNRIPGDWYAQQGQRNKTDVPTIHYNGPPTNVRTKADAVEQIFADARYHMRHGVFFAGTVDGIQYHSMVWEDTVYLLRDPYAILYHCGAWPENGTSHAVHVPIGNGERCSDRTLATLEEWVDQICDEWNHKRSCMGHQELSSTSCPGWLQPNFVVPYRQGRNFGAISKIEVIGEVGGGSYDLRFLREPEVINTEGNDVIVELGDGSWQWSGRVWEGGKDSVRCKDAPWIASSAPGIRVKVGGQTKKAPDNGGDEVSEARELIENMRRYIGKPYGWWTGGAIPERDPAWAGTGPAPEPQEVSTMFCAAVMNIGLRALGYDPPMRSDGSGGRGGVGAYIGFWYQGEWYPGVHFAAAEEFDSGKSYPEGTLLCKVYKSVDDQGHVGIVTANGYILQSYSNEGPGGDGRPGVNESSTLAESQSMWGWHYAVAPRNWIR